MSLNNTLALLGYFILFSEAPPHRALVFLNCIVCPFCSRPARGSLRGKDVLAWRRHRHASTFLSSFAQGVSLRGQKGEKVHPKSPVVALYANSVLGSITVR